MKSATNTGGASRRTTDWLGPGRLSSSWSPRCGVGNLTGVVLALVVGFTTASQPLLAVAVALFLLVAPVISKVGATEVILGLLVIRALVDGASVGTGLVGVAILPALTGALLAIVGIALTSKKLVGAYSAVIISSALLASTWYASTRWTGAVWEEGIRSVTVVFVFLGAMNLKNAISTDRLLTFFQLVSIIPAIYAVIQFATNTGMKVGTDIRASGTIAHPNSAALLFGMALLATIVKLSQANSKALNGAAIILFGCGVVSTASIGGLVSTLSMVAAYALTVPGVPARLRLFLVGAPAMLAWGFLTSSVGGERIAQLEGHSASGSSANSLEWRLSAWSRVLEVWSIEPFFGQGYGATTSRLVGVENIPHNEYVRLLTEIGLVGIAVVAIGVSLILVRMWRLRAVPGYGYLGAFTISIVVGLLVNSMGANTLLYSVPTYLAMLALGTGCALLRQYEKSRQVGVIATRAQRIPL